MVVNEGDSVNSQETWQVSGHFLSISWNDVIFNIGLHVKQSVSQYISHPKLGLMGLLYSASSEHFVGRSLVEGDVLRRDEGYIDVALLVMVEGRLESAIDGGKDRAIEGRSEGPLVIGRSDG